MAHAGRAPRRTLPHPVPRRSPHVIRRAAGVLAASVCTTVAALALVGAAAGAGPDGGSDDTAPAADDVLTVVAELTRSVDIGDHVVLRITIAADRLIEGEVRVASPNSTLVVRQEIQVTGGSTEELLLAVPIPGPDSASFDVELVAGGRTVDTDVVRFTHDAGTDVAGVMPVLLARAGEPPARVTLPGDLRRVDMTTVDLEVFELGPSALSQLDTVLATSDDLASLGPSARLALLGWLDRGGHLVLDDDADLTALPVGWQPGVGAYAFAGRGEVRLAEGRLTAASWEDVLAPASLSAYSLPFGMGGADMIIDPRVTLADRAGVSLPDLSRIVVVLGVYVLLVGPVLYLVLRRARRLTAAWVAIPVVALLVAGGVVVTSRGWTTSARSTAATVVESHPGGSHLAYQQLMSRRSGGVASFTVPAGWASSDQDQFGWWSAGAATRRTATSSAAGTRVEARLEPGQVAVLEAEGADDASLIAVDASIADVGTIRGTVTNTSGVDLVSVAVFGGGRGVLVGDLAAGASVEYELDGIADDPNLFDTPLRSVWSDPEFGLGFDAAPTPGVDAGIWTWFAAKVDADLYPRAMVRAAGWASTFVAPGDVAGSTDNVTLVTSVAPITNEADRLLAPTVRWSWIETAFDPRTGEPGTPVFRFVVPPGAPVDDLVLELPTGLTTVEVLDGRGRWVELGDRDDETREEEVAVPASAVRDGAVLVRTSIDQFANVDLSTVHPLLMGATP